MGEGLAAPMKGMNSPRSRKVLLFCFIREQAVNSLCQGYVWAQKTRSTDFCRKASKKLLLC